ncbi:MAG: substrate-binding domain-containing protein [Clostridiales bacterium]|nr:substrate-binding domain-containing protein [Clostridiales bacterium]
MKKSKLLLVFVAMLLITAITSCKKTEGNKKIILSTTTSTRDSGLLNYILPKFEEKYGYKVDVVAVGTGQALKLGMDGNADVLLVHAKSDEEKFVREGHGLKRFDVMYNDFVILGPEVDFANVKEEKDAAGALKKIADKKANFISRGDDSGTNKLEKKLWKINNINPSGDWYISIGKGMSETLLIANEKKAYTISDRATYLAMKDKLELKVLLENKNDLINQYGVIAVNPNKNSKINSKGAQDFIDWILSKETQKLIGEYGKEKYGQNLFIPNANTK